MGVGREGKDGQQASAKQSSQRLMMAHTVARQHQTPAWLHSQHGVRLENTPCCKRVPGQLEYIHRIVWLLLLQLLQLLQARGSPVAVITSQGRWRMGLASRVVLQWAKAAHNACIHVCICIVL